MNTSNSDNNPLVLLRQSNISHYLPTVLIIPLNSSLFNSTIEKNWNYHSHGVHFGHFLTNIYNRTIMPYQFHQNSTQQSIDLFFLPAYDISIKNSSHEMDWWKKMDFEISNFIASTLLHHDSHLQNFVDIFLDRMFIAASHPLHTRYINRVEVSFRNIMDIRFLRVDNDMTINGRDVFVPYVVKNSAHSMTDRKISPINYSPRKYIFSALCAPSGGGNDKYRNWRKQLYTSLLKQTLPQPSIIIINRIKNDFFEYYLKNSDFCAITPGDTSSTAKLSKSIFAGCIPVVFVSYNAQLPFYHLIDWTLFSIIVPKDHIQNHFKMTLLIQKLHIIRMNTTLLGNYKKHLLIASQLFDYENYIFPSVYHLTLLDLVLR